VGRKLQVQLV